MDEDARDDFSVSSWRRTLTLLSLVIGFSFSMAISRYDQRKNCEEAEANAIGTEYIRADLLPAGDAQRVRALLQAYIDQRVLFYVTRDDGRLQLRSMRKRRSCKPDLWSAVQVPAAAQPKSLSLRWPLRGSNDVLNAQGYAQAAWWSWIPAAAWMLMAAIAICGNVLFGYGARKFKSERTLRLVLPLVVSISFLLVADIDSPRSGVIRVTPQNLLSLSEWMHKQTGNL